MNRQNIPFLILIGMQSLSSPAQSADSSDNHCSFPVSTLQIEDVPENQLQISAETLEILNEEKLILDKKVKILSKDQVLLSDKASFNKNNQSLSAQGNIIVQRKDFSFKGDALELDLTNQTGVAKNSQYQMHKSLGNGSAESIEFSEGILQLTNANYTTCPPQDKAWQISAEEISLNQEENEGIARGAKIEIYDVPIFYIPYISFPIDGRKSGLLPPTPSYSSTDGLDLLIPYYFNLAPNYDLTLNPRYIEKRGGQLGAEFRYLQHNFAGEFGGEYLPADQQREIDRYQAHFKQKNYISSATWLTTNLTHVSDINYYSDLGTSLSVASKSQVDRNILLQTGGNRWFFTGILQDYQMLNGDVEPYRRLPQLSLYAQESIAGLTGNVFSQYSYFYKNQKDKVQRLIIKPEISLPLEKRYGHITPAIGLFGSAYQTETKQYLHKQAYAHVSGALIFDRMTKIGRQSLIPHFSYLNMPYSEHDQLPQIDNDIRPLSYDQLFFNRRYSGWDRFGDLHRFSFGLQNHWYNNNKRLVTFNVATSQILEEQHRNFLGDKLYRENDTFYASKANFALFNNLELNGEFITSDKIDHPESASVSAHYSQNSKDKMELRHDFRSNILQQTSLILTKSINSQWRIATRWAYSNKHEQIREGLFGLEYNNCCWSLRAVARRYASVIDEEAKNSIAVQFELKGLTAIGSRLEETFSQEIFGIK